jgi:hypothetical protein
MTIVELNEFLQARNLRQAETVITLAWRTINFLGGFFSGKLKSLDQYLPKTPEREQIQETKEEALKSALASRGFEKRWG